ncbi:16S rRNA (guanine(527)-N(7))-methyltransferase RsmG [Kineococcus glutinatus]|uniref:Ribosomal RNA small subunit methyltransferase G n=1 Tax=Kineococcus glutinatus TaxID=1070872 RepID=A0ABP9H6X5_9ACTN
MLGADSADVVPTTGGGGVSRETPPPPVVVPAVAADVFGPHLVQAERYAALLGTDGVVRGLIGPREVPRLWERHLLNSAALRHVVPEATHVVDIGSGAGLPGIPLALARPDLRVTLVEPLERRYHFLREAVAALDLADRCHVVRARAEELAGELAAPVVTARAVAALDKLAGWALPLTSTDGAVLAIKGRTAAQEIETAWPTLRRWGVPEEPEVLTCPSGIDGEDLVVVRVLRGTGPLRTSTQAGRGRQPRQAKAAGRGASRTGGRRGRGGGAARG